MKILLLETKMFIRPDINITIVIKVRILQFLILLFMIKVFLS